MHIRIFALSALAAAALGTGCTTTGKVMSLPGIGVNARNLKTLAIHPDTFSRLRPLIPHGCVTVAESGIPDAATAAAYAQQGADAVLVGEALVRTGDPRAGAAAIVAAGAPRTQTPEDL